jgi:hypothetical protein
MLQYRKSWPKMSVSVHHYEHELNQLYPCQVFQKNQMRNETTESQKLRPQPLSNEYGYDANFNF